jgi:ABC-type glutathione transport system ATPase component
MMADYKDGHKLALELAPGPVPSGPSASQIDARNEVEHIQNEEISDDEVVPLGRRDTESMIRDTDKAELVRLATQLSRRRSSVAVQPHVTSLGDIDENAPYMNPESESFDLSKWMRHFINQLQDEGVTAKHTGVSFRDLSVFGSGDAIQVQNTVASTLMAPLRLGEMFSFGEKKHKQILHGFNGLLRSGELLVVLGRPGSGCSTLLKSMCGELYGLKLGKDTKIHYDGIPQKQMKKEFKGEAIYNQEVGLRNPNIHISHLLTSVFPGR